MQNNRVGQRGDQRFREKCQETLRRTAEVFVGRCAQEQQRTEACGFGKEVGILGAQPGQAGMRTGDGQFNSCALAQQIMLLTASFQVGKGGAERVQKLYGINWLVNKVYRAEGKSGFEVFAVGIAADKEYLTPGEETAHLGCQRQTIHSRHTYIAEQYVGRMLPGQRQGIKPV